MRMGIQAGVVDSGCTMTVDEASVGGMTLWSISLSGASWVVEASIDGMTVSSVVVFGEKLTRFEVMERPGLESTCLLFNILRGSGVGNGVTFNAQELVGVDGALPIGVEGALPVGVDAAMPVGVDAALPVGVTDALTATLDVLARTAWADAVDAVDAAPTLAAARDAIEGLGTCLVKRGAGGIGLYARLSKESGSLAIGGI